MDGAIVVNNLTVNYGDFVAVNNVSFIVPRGEVFGFLGPNGSGKTTIIKTLCGLIKPSSGKASILGMDISSEITKIRRRIGYMSQSFSLYEDLTVEENLDFYATIYRLKGSYLKQRKDEVIELTGLAPYTSRLTKFLSGGWKQRLSLACSVVHEPEVVFLDEPTSGIDPVARRDVWNLLFKLSGQNITFFVTTHYMDEAERCERVGYIYLSELIAFGTVDELKTLPEVSPKGTVRLNIVHRSPTKILAFLNNLSYVLETTIFGKSVHTLLKNEAAIESLKMELSRVGLNDAMIESIEPSLEDVFVRLTKANTKTKER